VSDQHQLRVIHPQTVPVRTRVLGVSLRPLDGRRINRHDFVHLVSKMAMALNDRMFCTGIGRVPAGSHYFSDGGCHVNGEYCLLLVEQKIS
jgi:hypothetical protein